MCEDRADSTTASGTARYFGWGLWRINSNEPGCTPVLAAIPHIDSAHKNHKVTRMRLSVWGAARSLGDWFVMALQSLAAALAVGLLTAVPIGVEAIAISLTAAFVATTLGCLLVAWLARAPGEIAAPTPSTTVIYAALGADIVAHGAVGAGVWEIWAAMSLAVVMMGGIVFLVGLLRLAGFVKFMPSPVTAGFVTGIGMLVIWSQLGPILGVQWGGGGLGALWSQVKFGSVAVAAVTLAALSLLARFKRPGQPVLLAVFIGMFSYYLLSWQGVADASLGGTISALRPQSTAVQTVTSLWHFVTPGWVMATAMQVVPYAALLALQAIMNAAVTSVAIGNRLGQRSNVNRTLAMQGIANMVCGVLGALPVSTSAQLSMAASDMKANPRTVAVGKSIMLFVLVLLGGGWLTWIPVAVLAALLLMGGVAMVKNSTARLIKSAWSVRSRDQSTLWTLGIAIAVAAVLFLGGVPIALMVGSVLAMVLLAFELSTATRFGQQPSAVLKSRRVWSPAAANWLRGQSSKMAAFRPQGALFFGTADHLAQELASIAPGTRFCVLDLSRVTTVDATACEIIAAGARSLAAAGVTPLLAGVTADSARGRHLVGLGLSAPDPRTGWFVDLDHALEHAETALVRDQWPDADVNAGFEFGQTPLTAGMSGDELQEFKNYLKPIEIAAGPLFHQGDAGYSMYLVEAGQIEIQIASAERVPVRLAAFGPGSIFGEVSLVMSQQRTADAVCVTPARLLELDRLSLEEMEKRSIKLYAMVMRNLNVHIAKRLDLATGLVRSLQ